jgi:hypothetical protein
MQQEYHSEQHVCYGEVERQTRFGPRRGRRTARILSDLLTFRLAEPVSIGSFRRRDQQRRWRSETLYVR